jgi:hypothetical protein
MRTLKGFNVGGPDSGPVFTNEDDDLCTHVNAGGHKCIRPRGHTAGLHFYEHSEELAMPHGGLGTLTPSQMPSPGVWVERGAIADSAVRRVWIRSFDNIPIAAAGLTATTARRESTNPAFNTGTGGSGYAAVQFTRASDSLVMTVDAADIVAVSAT